MFCHYNKRIVNVVDIKSVTCENLVRFGYVHVNYFDRTSERVNGAEAINLVMLLAPGVLEGMRAKHVRHGWAVHNLIGHPLMQVLTWLRLTKAAMWVHDVTIPKPLAPNE